MRERGFSQVMLSARDIAATTAASSGGARVRDSGCA
jgi:hypothetical protein